MSSRKPDIDEALSELLSSECMSQELADKTMDRIRQARAAQEADRRQETETPADPVVMAETEHLAQDQPCQTRQPRRTHHTDQADQARRKPRKTMSRRHFVELMAACVAVAAVGVGAGMGTRAYADETAQVVLGDTAYVELGLNRWDRVVRASSDDAEIQQSLDAMGLVGLSCSDALDRLTSNDALCSRLLEDQTLVVSVSSDTSSQQDEVLGQCRAATQALPCQTMCMAADDDLRAEARACGMGVGRYSVYQEISELDPTITVDECRDMSMRELRDLLASIEESCQTADGAGSTDAECSASADSCVSSGTSASSTSSAASSTTDAISPSERHGHGMGAGMGMGSGAGSGMGNGMGAGAAHGSGTDD
jgi:hypothetical protein